MEKSGYVSGEALKKALTTRSAFLVRVPLGMMGMEKAGYVSGEALLGT